LKFVVDTHTHTIASGHAYSTVQEMAKEASANGIEMFAITDPGPAMRELPIFIISATSELYRRFYMVSGY